jgi:hypothetical protein
VRIHCQHSPEITLGFVQPALIQRILPRLEELCDVRDCRPR